MCRHFEHTHAFRGTPSITLHSPLSSRSPKQKVAGFIVWHYCSDIQLAARGPNPAPGKLSCGPIADSIYYFLFITFMV